MAKKNIDTTTMGGRIKQLRIDAGITQEILADSLCVSNKSSISNYERNITSPTLDQIIIMAKIFHTTTDYILTGRIEAYTDQLQKRIISLILDIKNRKTLEAAYSILNSLVGIQD